MLAYSKKLKLLFGERMIKFKLVVITIPVATWSQKTKLV